METISFIGNSESPEKLLDLFKKMTPHNSGIWGRLKGEPHYRTTYHAVIDYLPSGLGIDESKCVFLNAHPETMQAYRNMDSYKGLKMYDAKNSLGFLEWWLKYDYDYLSNLQPMQKIKRLGCIVSNANTQPYHKARLEWLDRFTNRKEELHFDLYGRIIPFTEKMKTYYRGVCGSYDPRGAASSGGNDHMTGKEEVYEQHKFMIEFDATGNFYMSERVLDCLLLWACPIYYGGGGIKVLPSESYINFTQNEQD